MPIRPVIRDETVTKKNPKTMTSSATRKLPCVGMPGTSARKMASSMEPPSDDRERDVALGAEWPPPRAPRRSPSCCRGTTTTIVGIVRASVMMPAASTAPAPV